MKLNKDNLIGVIIGFIVLVIFAVTKELLRRTQDSLNAYKSDTTISADYFVAKYKLERIRYYTKLVDKNSSQLKFYKGWIKRVLE